MDVDQFHAEVYKLGGGVTTDTKDSDAPLFAMVMLPGILTKYEPLPEAVERLEEYKRTKNEI